MGRVCGDAALDDSFARTVDASYRIVECSNERRSNNRKLPSAPTEVNTSVELGSHATSYTSRSCAISWVTAVEVLMSHTVQVVSIDEVTIWLGLSVFHENDVKGGPDDELGAFD